MGALCATAYYAAWPEQAAPRHMLPACWEGSTYATDSDDCAAEPCLNDGQCFDLLDGFACDCAPGFGGDTCAIDADDCADTPCFNGATCTDRDVT